MSGILSYSTLLLFIKRALRPVHLLSSSRNTITRSFLFYTIYLIHSLLYRSLFCMSPPQPYPSFTLVMSSESALFASFATNDNMRLPAYRTSRSTRFHPYSRPRPSLHQERLMVRLSHLCDSLHARLTPIRPQWTIVFPNLLRALFETWP